METKKRKTTTSTDVKRKYNEKTYETLTLSLHKGLKSQWKEQAKVNGFDSLTKYITFLIENDNPIELTNE